MLAPNLRDTNLYLFFGRKNIEKILRFQSKMLEYSRVYLAFTWYVFHFKFPPLKTFTRKTLLLYHSYERKFLREDCSFLMPLIIPWVPEVFLACGGNFRCWPKADTSSAVGRSHERRATSRGSL